MSNWSSDTFLFGRLAPNHEYTVGQQEIMRRIAYKPNTGTRDSAYIISRIEAKPCSPGVLFEGSGRWGCDDPLTDEFWDWARTGVVVLIQHPGDGDDIARAVIVSGELVWSDTVKLWESKPIGFTGRTPDEVMFMADVPVSGIFG